MTESEFKKLDLEKQVEIVNKRCDELCGRKLTEKFKNDEIQIDYQTVAKILNRQNYTLFRGRFYKVLIDENEKTEQIESVNKDEKTELFDLMKQVMSMKNTKSAYYKISDEIADMWQKFRNEKFSYIANGNLIVIAMLDFMNRNKY